MDARAGQARATSGGGALAYQYYGEERRRWPDFDKGQATDEEAMKAVKALLSYFLVRSHYPEPKFVFRKGHPGAGSANFRSITFHHRPTWLTVIHEVGHMVHERRGRRRRPNGSKERWHGKRHARIVDAAANYAIKNGWLTGVLILPEAHRENAARAAGRVVSFQRAAKK